MPWLKVSRQNPPLNIQEKPEHMINSCRSDLGLCIISILSLTNAHADCAARTHHWKFRQLFVLFLNYAIQSVATKISDTGCSALLTPAGILNQELFQCSEVILKLAQTCQTKKVRIKLQKMRVFPEKNYRFKANRLFSPWPDLRWEIARQASRWRPMNFWCFKVFSDQSLPNSHVPAYK